MPPEPTSLPAEPSDSDECPSLAVGYLRGRNELLFLFIGWSMLLAWLGVTKGWFLFMLLPALLPIVLIAHNCQTEAAWTLRASRMRPVLSLRIARIIEALAAAQLILVPAAYLCVPMATDTNDSSAFTVITADLYSPVVKISALLAALSAVAALAVTVALFVVLGTLRKRVRPRYQGW